MSTHPKHDEDFDLYALGALEGDEKKAIESHVATCSDCTRKLAEARGRISLLAFSAPPVAPSPGVKEGLMRQLHASAEGRLPVRAASEPERHGGFFGRGWSMVFAPVAAVLALAAIFLYTENARLQSELSALRATADQQKLQANEARDILHIAQANDTVVVALKKMPGSPDGDAKVSYNAKMGKLFYDGWIEPAPAGKSYQLWLVPMQGDPVNAGVFTPAKAKMEMWTATVPQGMPAKMFAVTLEPTGGMPHPTGPMIFVGPAS
jgi:anti-sigma-K factor RskA